MASRTDGLITPRLAGLALIAISLSAGVASGWAFPHPQWSIPAALVLTAATVGMAAGILWTLRKSWADATWPPGGVVRTEAEKARRSLRIFGLALLAPSPVIVAFVVWAAIDTGIEWWQALTMGAVALLYAAGGIALLQIGRAERDASLPRPSHTQRPVADDPETGPWRALGPTTASRASAEIVTGGIVVVTLLPLQLVFRLEDARWAAPILLGMLVVIVAVLVVVVRRRRPQVRVSVEEQRIQAGSRSASWSEIDSAELLATPVWEGSARTLVLVLRDRSGLSAPVLLRRQENLALTEQQTDLALRIIDASAIELPRAKEDPRGKFSKQLYPTHVTRQEARDLVANPPGMNEPVPVTG